MRKSERERESKEGRGERPYSGEQSERGSRTGPQRKRERVREEKKQKRKGRKGQR